jgi:hypothetical protein
MAQVFKTGASVEKIKKLVKTELRAQKYMQKEYQLQ